MARMEPYRLSDLDRLIDSIRKHRLVQITSIGKTAGGRDLEVIRIGDADAPYRVFVRGRAHPWESGSSWVAHGLIQRLLKDDADAKKFLGAVRRLHPADGEQRRRRARHDALQRQRQGPQSKLGQAGRPGTGAGERGAGKVARGHDRRGPAAASGARAAQRRPRAAAHQPAAGAATRPPPRAHGHARGPAPQEDLVHRRRDHRGVPQQRHSR